MELLFILFLIAGSVGGALRLRDYINRKKEKKERKIEHQKHQKYIEQQKIIEKAIIDSEEFKRRLHSLSEISRCFNLAGGLDPFLPSLLKYGDKKNEIIIEKQGYDLWITNLNEYYNNPAPQCYEALNRFAVDLFGEYADEMKSILSIEYIADHLIELENIDEWKTDFVLKYKFSVYSEPSWNYGGDIRELYIKNLWRA